LSADPILTEVLAILAQIAGPGRTPMTPGYETPLAEEGFWLDSIGLLDALLTCEETFGVALDYESIFDADGCATAGRLAAAVRARRVG
jgi:acyl carrier protein